MAMPMAMPMARVSTMRWASTFRPKGRPGILAPSRSTSLRGARNLQCPSCLCGEELLSTSPGKPVRWISSVSGFSHLLAFVLLLNGGTPQVSF